jgi:hypothetical protein
LANDFFFFGFAQTDSEFFSGNKRAAGLIILGVHLDFFNFNKFINELITFGLLQPS